MNTIQVNGKTYQSKCSVIVNGKDIYIDGKKVEKLDDKGLVTIIGNVHELVSDKDVSIEGNVDGNIKSHGGISVKGDIKGDVKSHGGISVDGNIVGNTKASGGISVKGDITGNVKAGGGVKVNKIL